jgi:hypothetical protein
MRVRNEPSRKSDPQLQYFIDCVRECLGKEPLYDRHYRPDIERFNIHPFQLPATPTRAPVY